MKTVTLFPGLGRISLLSMLCISVASSAFSASRLTIKQEEFRFGFVPQNSSVSHPFWLYSTGDDTLKILNVVPGCSCTKAPLEKSDLAVGDSTRLEIIYDTRVTIGDVAKQPHIETNEGKPDKFVRILATVVNHPDSTSPLVIKPYKLDLSQFSEKKRDTLSFTVTNVTDKPLDMDVVFSYSDFFDLKLPKTIGANQTVHGNLKLKKNVLDKEFEKTFTIEVNDENKSRFTVPVKRSLKNPTPDATAANAAATSGH